MRILALHGVGCSADIFRAQLDSFITATQGYYELVFVDGFVESHRGPCIGPHVPGPFYSHTRGYTPADIHEAHEHLADIIAETGPFDGILGFSQGGSVAMSYMYHRQLSGLPPDFKFAIILSSVVPFSPDPAFCDPQVRFLCAQRRLQDPGRAGTRTNPDEEAAPATFTHSVDLFKDCLDRTFDSAAKIGATPPDFDRDFFGAGEPNRVPRVLHPLLVGDERRLAIPTVHAQGRKDTRFMRDMADTARGLCDDPSAVSLVHAGGHCPPQSARDVDALAQAVHWAARQHHDSAHL